MKNQKSARGGCLKSVAITIGGMIATAVIGVFGWTGYNAYRYNTAPEETVTAKVISVNTIVKNGESAYMVNTLDESFINADNPLKGKFSKANDMQRKIHADSTYTFRVGGFRSTAFDTYRNILSVQPAK